MRNSSQPKETAGYARYITEAGTRLLGILNGVLDLARIEAGRVEMAGREDAVLVGGLGEGEKFIQSSPFLLATGYVPQYCHIKEL